LDFSSLDVSSSDATDAPAQSESKAQRDSLKHLEHRGQLPHHLDISFTYWIAGIHIESNARLSIVPHAACGR
jgi:hypothetical protein